MAVRNRCQPFTDAEHRDNLRKPREIGRDAPTVVGGDSEVGTHQDQRRYNQDLDEQYPDKAGQGQKAAKVEQWSKAGNFWKRAQER